MLLSPIPPTVPETVVPTLHIPDGFLSLAISIIFWILAVVLLTVATRRTQNSLGERQIPLMGIMAAFIFAAQMINFPIAGGTSGHMLGGALAGMVLGPWAGMLVVASVIGLQALLFQDGGLLVMGANIFNMGLLPVLIGYGLYRSVTTRGRGVRLGTVGIAAWVSVMAAALATALQLWLSGTSPLRVVMPAMLGIHALIGIGEALITVAALAFIMRVRPDVLSTEATESRGGRGWVVAGGAIALLLVLFAPWASADPDGLERVAGDLGFLGAGLDAPYQMLPDYTIPMLGETGLSTVVAGIIGTLIVAAIAIGIGRLLRRSPKTAPGSN